MHELTKWMLYFRLFQDLPSRSSHYISSHEYDTWSHDDLAINPTNEAKSNLTFEDRSSLVSTERDEHKEKPDFMGFLARKVQNARKSYRGTTKKWIPLSTQTTSFNWAVLEGSRLYFYENEGGEFPCSYLCFSSCSKDKLSQEETWIQELLDHI